MAIPQNNINPQQLQQQYQDLIPDGFNCIVTAQMMQNPVVHKSCGNSFDLPMVQQWLQQSQTCMTCRRPATMADFVVNRNLSDSIQEMPNILNRLHLSDQRANNQTARADLAENQRDHARGERDEAREQNANLREVNNNIKHEKDLLEEENRRMTLPFKERFIFDYPQESLILGNQMTEASHNLQDRIATLSVAFDQIFMENEAMIVQLASDTFFNNDGQPHNFFRHLKTEAEKQDSQTKQAWMKRIASHEAGKEGEMFYRLGQNFFNSVRSLNPDILGSPDPQKAKLYTVWIDISGSRFSALDSKDPRKVDYNRVYLDSNHQYKEADKNQLDEVESRLRTFTNHTNWVKGLFPNAKEEEDMESVQDHVNENNRLLERTAYALDQFESCNRYLTNFFAHYWGHGAHKAIFLTERQKERLETTKRDKEKIRSELHRVRNEIEQISGKYTSRDLYYNRNNIIIAGQRREFNAYAREAR